MPLNEAYGFHRSNLTKEQKRAAEAAVYGQPVPTMPPNALTPEEIERMRTLVAQHDSQGAVKEFDLNNPVTPPYVFQPFPTTVYHAKLGNKVVPDQEALDEALAAGWKHAPPDPKKDIPPETEPDAAKEEPNAADHRKPAAKK
jgi:hypothetical protein